VDEEEALGFIGEWKVLRTTSDEYERKFMAWVTWLRERNPDTAASSLVLSSINSERGRAVLLSLYLKNLYAKGMRGDQITAVVSALRHSFLMRGGDMGAFSHEVFRAMRQSCRITNPELREKTKRGEGRGKLQVGMPVLEELRKRYWDPPGWSIARLDGRTTYVSAVFTWDGCYRRCEVSENANRIESDHCLKKGDLCWGVRNRMGIVVHVWGTAALILTLSGGGIDRIVECEAFLWSSKTRIGGGGKLLGRTSPEASEFLDQFAAVIIALGGADTDGIFTRVTLKDRTEECVKGLGTLKMQAKRIASAVKEACGALGLNPTQYSAHSLRKGGLSQLAANGATDREQETRGNWATGSRVMREVYRCRLSSAVGPLGSLGNAGPDAVCNMETMRYLSRISRRENMEEDEVVGEEMVRDGANGPSSDGDASRG
jgi:hypothetical protein